MNEIRQKKKSLKNSEKSDVKVVPEGQQNGSGSVASTTTSIASGISSGNGVEDSSESSSDQRNSMPNPETKQLVNDFEQNVFLLLTTKVKWRLKSEDGSAGAPEVLNNEPTPAEIQEALKYIDDLCKKFDSCLVVKDDVVDNGAGRAVMSGPSVEYEVDDGGYAEFNPFKLVAILGQKLKLAAHLMDVIKHDKGKKAMIPAIDDKGVPPPAPIEQGHAAALPLPGNMAATRKRKKNTVVPKPGKKVAVPEEDDYNDDDSMPPLHYFP